MSDCRALLETSTPYTYRRNAFRITGLPADVSIRDIKRRIDDLKHAEEIGDLEDENSHAFSMTPPPTLEHIREAAQILQDPEKRIVQEFYWFWPFEWGKGKTDPALVALSKGDRTKAFNIWKTALIGHPEGIMLISKHNLAVLYQLTALDEELANLQKNPAEETLKQIDKYWRSSFKFWEEIIAEDHFWELVTDRILSAGDPRLTASLVSSLRTTLPKALHKIHGELALIYLEKGHLSLANGHRQYISTTYEGLIDNVSAIYDLITEPLQKRIRDAVSIALSVAESQPDKGAEAASDLFKNAAAPLEILRQVLPPNGHKLLDLIDAVTEAGLSCLKAFARKQKDWKTCLSILEEWKKSAMYATPDIRLHFAVEYASFRDALSLDQISKICDEADQIAESKPEEAVIAGNRLIADAQSLIAKLDASTVNDNVKNSAKDMVAGTLARCAIAYGNKMAEWKGSVGLLETAQGLAKGAELKEFIDRNLKISRQNNSFEGLQPIKSAPDLDTWNGMGFRLYGSTDRDPDTNSFLSTYYFVFLLIPIFPIRRYRVIPIDNGYRFLGKAPLRRFDKIHLAISLILIGLFILNIATNESGSLSRTSSSPSSPRVNASSPPSYNNQSTRLSLRTEIENGKRRAKELESQIQELDGRIENYKGQLDFYRRNDMADEHNALIPTYNSLVRQRNSLFVQYDSLINDVNRKVNAYNTGSR